MNFIFDPSQTPHTSYCLRIFRSNRSKSNFFSTSLNQATKRSSLCKIFLSLIINRWILFSTLPRPLTHYTAYAFFGQKQDKIELFSTLPNQASQGSSLCKIVFSLIIKRRILFLTPPRPPTHLTAYAFLRLLSIFHILSTNVILNRPNGSEF